MLGWEREGGKLREVEEGEGRRKPRPRKCGTRILTFAEKIAKPGVSTTCQLSTDSLFQHHSSEWHHPAAPAAIIATASPTPLPLSDTGADTKHLATRLARPHSGSLKPRRAVNRVRLAFLVPMAIFRGRSDWSLSPAQSRTLLLAM